MCSNAFLLCHRVSPYSARNIFLATNVFLRNFFLFSMYSNSHNFRNNNRVELIFVPNDAEFSLVFKSPNISGYIG